MNTQKWDDEIVDILDVNTFSKLGVRKSIYQAHHDGDWIGGFNLWILQRNPEPSILYQQRSSSAALWPALLDVTAGGHYIAGENTRDGLREVREEIGKDYNFDDLLYLGKKILVSDKSTGEKLRYCVDVFFFEDNNDIFSFRLQREEVAGLYICPLNQLLDVHSGKLKEFVAHGVNCQEELASAQIIVNKNMFPYNWDQYHFKIAILAERYFRDDHFLLY